MNEATVKKTLLAGAEILAPILEPYAFVFTVKTHGQGSGGCFASGAFFRADRRLELHFRYSLGLVTYHVDQESLDHETYMRLLGVHGMNQYPDFPSEPLESFRHLAMDLRNYCQDFVSGDGKHFHSLVETLAKNPRMFRGIP
ncbi:MAG TPA: hypothetical protein VLA83_01375 [Candidatus Binatia bacterium]|nr:hypothetical protein [Candidatus Binatia bacterium]